jgi:hypothetical protein
VMTNVSKKPKLQASLLTCSCINKSRTSKCWQWELESWSEGTQSFYFLVVNRVELSEFHDAIHFLINLSHLDFVRCCQNGLHHMHNECYSIVVAYIQYLPLSISWFWHSNNFQPYMPPS